MMSEETNVFELKELSDDELLESYHHLSDTSINSKNINQVLFLAPKTSVFATELQRRENEKQRMENEKANKIMRNWTVAIGIMTAVMLLVTITNVIIFILRG